MAQQPLSSNISNFVDLPSDATKSEPKYRPYYFSSFQNRCQDSNSTETTSARPKNNLSIPKFFKEEVKDLLNIINSLLIENLPEIAQCTSTIPNGFLSEKANPQLDRYLIDQNMLDLLMNASIVNWARRLVCLYPIQTSGRQKNSVKFYSSMTCVTR